jgi:hypothetical protein
MMDSQFQSFAYAEAFYEVFVNTLTRALKIQDDKCYAFVQAAFVNHAFSLETYLKCILLIEGNKAWGHELHDLFEKLSDVSRKRITEIYDSISDNHPQRLKQRKEVGDYSDYNIGSILREVEGAYNETRYYYQDNKKPEPGTGSRYRVDPVLAAVRIYMKELRPEWKQLEIEPTW